MNISIYDSQKALKEADGIIIGASNGLSISEGYITTGSLPVPGAERDGRMLSYAPLFIVAEGGGWPLNCIACGGETLN